MSRFTTCPTCNESHSGVPDKSVALITQLGVSPFELAAIKAEGAKLLAEVLPQHPLPLGPLLAARLVQAGVTQDEIDALSQEWEDLADELLNLDLSSGAAQTPQPTRQPRSKVEVQEADRLRKAQQRAANPELARVKNRLYKRQQREREQRGEEST